MKPLRLKFCGLHSYCDTQDIDFAWLGAKGLFGIFGPTGAGKSTILDAMTLALYGNVERANKGTRGIINQNSDQLWVKFEFELGGERYLVEQRYQMGKKDDQLAAINKLSRLCQFDPASGEFIPKAERIGEVTKTIENLIGLTRDDFTKAVVLPQGKFDAFLSLGNKNKAVMLEKIFNLSCYGDSLYQKASQAKEQAKQEKEKLEGELRGLGDCSLSLLEAKRVEKAYLSHQVEECKKSLNSLRQEEERARRIKEWFEEKAQLEKKKKELDAQSLTIKQKEEEIDLAERAERCRSYLDQLKSLQTERKKEANSLAQKQKALQDQQERHQEFNKTYRLIRQERDEKRDQLLERRERLKSCLTFYEQSKEKKKEQAKKQAESSKLNLELSQLERELAADQQNFQTEKDRLFSLNQQIENYKIDPEQKRLISEAYKYLSLLEEKEKCLTFEQDSLNKTIEEQEKAKQQKKKAVEEHLAASIFWSSRQQEAALLLPQGWEISGCWVEPLLETERCGLKQALLNCEEALDSLKQRSEGAHLALRLKDGEPCPVCGSRQHPAPALPEGIKQELARWEREKKSLQDEQQRLSQLELNLAKITATLSAKAEEVERQKGKIAAMEDEHQRVLAEFSHLAQGLSRDKIRESYHSLSRQDEEVARLREEQKKQTDSLDCLRQKIEQEKENKSKLEARQAALKESLSDLAKSLDELDHSIQAVTQGRAIRSLIEENESAIADLDERFKKAETNFRNSEQRLQELTRELDACRGKLDNLIEHEEQAKVSLSQQLQKERFPSIEAMQQALRTREAVARLKQEVKQYQDAVTQTEYRLKDIAEHLAGQQFDPAAYEQLTERLKSLEQQADEANRKLAVVSGELERLEKNHQRWQQIEQEIKSIDARIERADELARLFKGRALVTFLSHEYLAYMCREASECLGFLTGGRYALRVDQDNNFFMIDNFNGGKERPVYTLSGGETFLTALSLALALSSQVQSRGRSQHLGFFFLDEGFGSLDSEKLDLVMNTLERLRTQQERIVGIISHVQELRERMPRYLEVHPSRAAGTGSWITRGWT
ncbi:MAG: SMC family ATPase [bacterium]|nr:SMC family ATPase [bacterium]